MGKYLIMGFPSRHVVEHILLSSVSDCVIFPKDIPLWARHHGSTANQQQLLMHSYILCQAIHIAFTYSGTTHGNVVELANRAAANCCCCIARL